MDKRIIVAIDGPAGSGKTSSAKIVAEKLGYLYIDTGAMYRACTLKWLRSGQELNEENICKLMEKIQIELKQSSGGQITLLDGEDVSHEIRIPEVTGNVSPVSTFACVREKMVAQQRLIGEAGGVVMDGRDIGTAVFPQADLKVYLIASIESRAMRRLKEQENKGIIQNIKEVKKQIEDRDKIDSTREISPLRKADDAILIDTSDLTIDEQTQKIITLAKLLIERGD